MEHIIQFISGLNLTLVYLGCLCMGMFYSLIVLVFGGHGGGDNHGGFHLSDLIGGGNGGGTDGTPTGHVQINFLSPLSITAFLAGFGAFGLIFLHAMGVRPLASIFASGGAAAVLDVGLNLFLYKVFIRSQASSLVRESDLIGLDAEVLSTISADGVGEIAYVSKSGRQVSLARSADKVEIPKDEIVKIVKMVGGTAVVRKNQIQPS